jgi:hypothetical protein
MRLLRRLLFSTQYARPTRRIEADVRRKRVLLKVTIAWAYRVGIKLAHCTDE